MELLESEKHYHDNLRTVISLFYDPLEKECIFTPNYLWIMFCNIKDIANAHLSLIAIITEKFELANRSEVSIGRCSVSNLSVHIVEYSQKYLLYFSNLRKALKLLHSMNSNDKDIDEDMLNEWHSLMRITMQDERVQGTRFDDWLMKPVNRGVNYYIGWYDKVLMATPPQHPDYSNIVLTLESLKNLQLKLDKAKDSEGNKISLTELEKQFAGKLDIVVSGRQLIYDTEARAFNPGQGSYYFVHLFPFNDILIVSQLPSNSVLRKAVRIFNISLSFSILNIFVTESPSHVEDCYDLKVMCKQTSSKVIISFNDKEVKEKKKKKKKKKKKTRKNNNKKKKRKQYQKTEKP
eukprot:TRINITY_DN14240_c0_g1_i1.p1 TRINITY_DN14240_c0_g1~~TRINITY_DN14240_c0_g1_i1.p1  ORF type:complete len:349 (-),score=73.49 TRINITY_DN14240_c0_g1_i1:24-1070(-)